MEHLAKPIDMILTPLRPHLRPITQHLPGPVRDTAVSMLGPKCFRVLLLELAAEPECLTLALSKVLGVGIIGMSSVVKVPQLIKIVRAKSGAGLSFSALALETASFIITASYNFRSANPFSTYGEAALISCQNVAIGAAMQIYDGATAEAAMWIATAATLALCLSLEEAGVRFEVVKMAMACASAVGVLSKIPQIVQNYDQGNTGQLSAFAVFAFLFGSGSRIFTTMQEVQDPILLAGFAAGFVLNIVLAAQMIYYWNAPMLHKSARKHHADKAKKAQAQAIEAEKEAEQAETTGAKTKAKAPRSRKA